MDEESQWLSLWSIARFDLRLTDEQFWILTFKEFSELQKRWLDQKNREDLRVGLMLSQTYNMNRSEKQKALGPETWFPNLKQLTKPKINEAKQAGLWMNWAASLKARGLAKSAPKEDRKAGEE